MTHKSVPSHTGGLCPLHFPPRWQAQPRSPGLSWEQEGGHQQDRDTERCPQVRLLLPLVQPHLSPGVKRPDSGECSWPWVREKERTTIAHPQNRSGRRPSRPRPTGIPQTHLRRPDSLYKGCSVASTEPRLQKAPNYSRLSEARPRPQPPPHTEQEVEGDMESPRPCQATEKRALVPWHGDASLEGPRGHRVLPAPWQSSGEATGRGGSGADVRGACLIPLAVAVAGRTARPREWRLQLT